MQIAVAIAAAAAVAAAFCLFRLALAKREIRSFARQLRRYNDGEASGRVAIGLPDRDLEALAAEINRHTGLIVTANAERRRTEEELRQAVANISHDLRTPLTSIFGYIQMLDSQGLSEDERREAIAVIRKRTLRLQSLLNDFYELAMIDSPDYALKPTKLRLDKLLPEILMGFYDQMKDNGLEPSFALDEDRAEIWADESAVRRVVENLVVNALRHARGKLVVRLAVDRESAAFSLANEASHLRGTDPELLFNRFYMADVSRSGLSSGLGLSISRGLMTKMGGSLKAEMREDALWLICVWNRHA
ncbi:sensor histidine kinase [Cohnella sp. JJ-181]|uniref:sensor histidine kinase n=1 Tax=Cohnella rhizoplanae TaxID=2974897 RepID=UPI0022FF6C3E|nr:HAMP domain-containing sensor histidine kinase [Cohnella sp. JJ-181]CAI6032347.1 Adaptive-response sensory-kinase SasA [Cohnella sp. JJ-181]